METPQTLLWLAANFGVGVLFAFLLLRLYAQQVDKLTDKLTQVIEENTRVMTGVQSTLSALHEMVKSIAQRLDQENRR